MRTLIAGAFVTLDGVGLREGLVDQLNLGVHPVAVGEGERIFDAALPRPLRLVAATPSPTGVVTLSYAP